MKEKLEKKKKLYIATLRSLAHAEDHVQERILEEDAARKEEEILDLLCLSKDRQNLKKAIEGMKRKLVDTPELASNHRRLVNGHVYNSAIDDILKKLPD